MKIAYAGFDLLYPALEAIISGHHEIMKIFSCMTDNVTEFNLKVTETARRISVPITYEKITENDLEELLENGCEALICAGYYYRMPINKGLKMVNIHPAMLPVGRGAWPMPLTILKGMDSSGVTFHKMEESFDTGDILMQRAFEVSKDEDLESFMQKVYDLLPSMILELFSNFDYYYENAQKQGEGEYWECPDEGDYFLNGDTEFEQADLILRAFYGYECIYKSEDKVFAVQFGRAIRGDSGRHLLKLKNGYISADKIREL